jgi:hypothetical protein
MFHLIAPIKIIILMLYHLHCKVNISEIIFSAFQTILRHIYIIMHKKVAQQTPYAFLLSIPLDGKGVPPFAIPFL